MPSEPTSQGTANAFIMACVVFFFLGYSCGKIAGLESPTSIPKIEVKCVSN